jgi:hypothetical protein
MGVRGGAKPLHVGSRAALHQNRKETAPEGAALSWVLWWRLGPPVFPMALVIHADRVRVAEAIRGVKIARRNTGAGSHSIDAVGGQPKPGQYGCGIFGLGRGPAHPFGRPAFLRPASFAYDALWKKQTSGRPQTATLAEKCTSRCGRDQERSFVNRMAHVGSCACKRCLLGRLTTEARGVYASGGDGGRTSASAPSCRCQCISTCCDPLAATSWQMTGLIPERSRIGSATRRSRTPHATPN